MAAGIITKIRRKWKRDERKDTSKQIHKPVSMIGPSSSQLFTSTTASILSSAQHDESSRDEHSENGLSHHQPMDRALMIHLETCSRAACPCSDLDDLEHGIGTLDTSSKSDKTWIREKLQKSMPTLKALQPWIEIIDAVSQVNPISGQVSGCVKVALKVMPSSQVLNNRNLNNFTYNEISFSWLW
ncbi:hypothetical protein BT63DRAFT_275668 [Microthyrium microscopicum]|uniref:Uncharacterized protein n=1 Tax=Microthyrium microscopicum TaxID=703497 RepID=A0A6A6U806_9PEZI|nr:hypothetical protein BT63DRAFT_275668 [Microthyrium microscopicum]